jgi:pimeloyl-ACP methyl ester carboxylesterase
VIENQSGPVVVVGHSYGGAVITAAAAGNPNVKALVYVPRLLPNAGKLSAHFMSRWVSLRC